MNINMTISINNITTVVTHGGIFHTDDVLAVSVMKAIRPDIQVVRTFKVTPEMVEDPHTIILDVGGSYDPAHGMLDHHGQDCPVYEYAGQNHKKAAIGLLVDYLGADGMIAESWRRSLVCIQDIDNGADEATRYHDDFAELFRTVVKSSNTEWDSVDTPDNRFQKVVEEWGVRAVREAVTHAEPTPEFIADLEEAKTRLKAEHAASEQRAFDLVSKSLNEMSDDIVVLGTFAPWQRVLVPTECRFVVYPALRGGANLQAVPVSEGSFTSKQALPEGWMEVKPEGCTFVHAARHLAAFTSVEAALAAAKTLV